MADDPSGQRSWDQIEGIPDPEENLHLVGHRGTLDLLARRYATGRMHHAWLLSGPRGIGKATLACRFAGHLFRNPDPASAPHDYVVPVDNDPGPFGQTSVPADSHPILVGDEEQEVRRVSRETRTRRRQLRNVIMWTLGALILLFTALILLRR